MKKEIVKAEILWTRKCNLNCVYCGMKKERERISIEKWKEGIDNLKRLKCRFMAIYGAEPLFDFEGLPEFIKYATEQGILTTVITNGTIPDSKEKIRKLYDNGLRSLTVSYDGEDIDYDLSVGLKAKKGLELALWFRDNFQDLRDTALIMTATTKNFFKLPRIIKAVAEKNLWVFFDFIHNDRGQYGTKCRDSEITRGLMFSQKDIPLIRTTIKELMELKRNGYFVHTSWDFLNMIYKNPFILLRYAWHCALSEEFPAWLSIDCNGEVYACDDFQVKNRKKVFYVWEIADRYEEFAEYWKNRTLVQCPGCVWNTHIDANLIKEGVLNFDEYVHKNSS